MVAATAAIAIPTGGAGGNAATPSLAGKTIGQISAGREYYYQCQDKGVKKQVAALGGKLVTVNSEANAQKQLANGQDMIVKGVDAILLTSTDAATGRKVIDAARKAKIPVVLVGIGVPGATPDTALLLNFQTMGELMGKWIRQNRPRAKLGVIQGLPGQGVTEAIRQGLAKALKGSSVEIVADQPGDWSRQKAGSVAQNMLQANPEINLLYVFNEDMSVGVLQALRVANKKVELVSDNGSADGIQMIKQGRLLATVAQSPSNEGILSVNLAARLLAGQKVPKVEAYPLSVVTKKNVNALKVPFCL
jgi:ribose transport system substrate-binding protein